ncbi:MAG: helix-turn-helix domain-containing protein [Chloroflexota bacterium]
MSWIRIGRAARAIRLRLRLRQSDVAARARVSRSAVSLLERGHASRLGVGTVEAILAAVGARLEGRLSWGGPDLDRMLDAGHAGLQAAVKRMLERWGWVARVEVSFNRYGERGRIDLLARHPPTGIMLVVEIKTELADAQQLLGTMDARRRLAPNLVRGLGWPRPAAVVPVIVFAERRATRRRLAAIDALFSDYVLRGRAGTAWVHRPSLPAPSGLLWFSEAPNDAVVRVSGQRVRFRRSEGRR